MTTRVTWSAVGKVPWSGGVVEWWWQEEAGVHRGRGNCNFNQVRLSSQDGFVNRLGHLKLFVERIKINLHES